jgi:hypothetical protein
MTLDPNSYFHIKPDGGIWLFGPGRKLSNEDYAAISAADPRLTPDAQEPQVESDSYGHANRLLELLGGTRIGRWIEWPRRWRERRS